MECLAHERYKWICRQLETDAEYLHLMERLREATGDFQAALEALPPAQRANILEYLGILGEISDRTKEICCYVPK
jgi:hypothetical protein